MTETEYVATLRNMREQVIRLREQGQTDNANELTLEISKFIYKHRQQEKQNKNTKGANTWITD